VDVGHDVVLGIDANETLFDEVGESALLGLVERCVLIDVMASMNLMILLLQEDVIRNDALTSFLPHLVYTRTSFDTECFQRIQYSTATIAHYRLASQLNHNSATTQTGLSLKSMVNFSVGIRKFFQSIMSVSRNN
jgi:hypothetical protein